MLGLLAPFAVFRRVAPENVGPLTLFLVERREILGRISGLCQAKLRLKRAAGRPQGRVSATSEVTHDLASSQRKIYLSIYLSSHACQVASHGTHLSDPDRPQTNSGMLRNSVR
jgi:hypothetical protein